MNVNYHIKVLKATMLIEFKSAYTNLIDPVTFVFYRVAKPLFGVWIIVMIYYAASTTVTISSFDFIPFVIIGNAIFAYPSTLLWGIGMSLTREREEGRFRLIYTSPANRFVWMLGKSIAEIFNTTIDVILLISFGIFFFGMRITGTPNWPLALVSLLATLASIYSFGYILAGLVLVERHGEFLANMLNPIFFLLCGINYPITILPDWVQAVSRMIPVTYGIDAVRKSVMQSGEVGAIWENLVMLLAFGALFTIISIMLFRILDYMARRRAMIDITV